MPTIKKNNARPWKPERKPFEGAKRRNVKFYNSKQWRTVSRLYKEENPICEHCDKKGLTVPADHTDHIIPVEDGGAKYDFDNLQALCRSCHGKKTSKELRKK